MTGAMFQGEGRKWVNFYTGEKLKDFVKVIE